MNIYLLILTLLFSSCFGDKNTLSEIKSRIKISDTKNIISRQQIYRNLKQLASKTNIDLDKISKKTLSYKHSTKAHLVKSLNLKGLTHIIGDGMTDCEVWRKGYADEFYAFTENIRREVVVRCSRQAINCLDDYIKIIS